MYYVSFHKIGGARTGNVLFQYLFCKVLGFKFGHQYVALEDDTPEKNYSTGVDVIKITEDNVKEYFEKEEINSHILLDGFFQNMDYYYKYRNMLLCSIKNSQDSWIYYEKRYDTITQGWNVIHERIFIRDFFRCSHKYNFTYSDIVVSLRLDDFYQATCSTTDIIPVSHYLSVIEKIIVPESRVYILCDKIRYEWEAKYISFFNKYNPVLIQESVMHDCAVMRDCPVLLHSNSTLCWIMSFLSENKILRVIPKTGFNSTQNLGKIEEGDQVYNVKPMTHAEVGGL